MTSKNQSNCFLVYFAYRNPTSEKIILKKIINLNNTIKKTDF